MTAQVSRKTIFAFLGPAVAALVLVGIAPLLYAVWTSLHNFNLTKQAQTKFIGLQNYAEVLTDPVFWQALTNNLWFALGTIPVSIALAILMGLLVWLQAGPLSWMVPAAP
jgi:multiple sugar transport system permease protein